MDVRQHIPTTRPALRVSASTGDENNNNILISKTRSSTLAVPVQELDRAKEDRPTVDALDYRTVF
jgi:hypothetical protein